MDDDIKIRINKDEALVLFEYLSRFVEDQQLTIVHQSEQRVLWNLQALLESKLTDPFDKEYSQILDEARKKVCDKT